MHRTGIALIFLSVTIRALVEQSTGLYLGPVILLLLIYGSLLFGEQALMQRFGEGSIRTQQLFLSAYLIIEMCPVIGLLMIPPTNDYPALLFIPLSLQAVLFFPQRSGFSWITVFTLVIVFFLTWDVDSVPQGLAMAFLFGGICYLVGSYAIMIRKAETARMENQRTFERLQLAHQTLQGFASQSQELAAINERIRLARELHDSVTQTVFSMNLAAQTARFLWPKDPQSVNTQFERFLELSDSAMRQIKTMVAHLGSQPGIGEELVPAIQQLIAERQMVYGFHINIDVKGERKLREEEHIALFRIVQEALTNISKHADTKEATIRLNFTENPIVIEIEDQGIGFDLPKSQNQPGHIGLVEMAERAEEIGWGLSIDTQPGRGTRIRVEKHITEE